MLGLAALAAFACTSSDAALAAAAQNFDFKGITLGKRHTPAEVKERLGVTCGEGHKGLLICNGNVTIAETPAQLNLVISKAGNVQRIDLKFREGSYATVRGALVQKFGKPSSVNNERVQNAYGAQYLNEVSRWIGDQGAVLEMERFYGTRDTSSVNFSTPEDRKFLDSVVEQRAKDL